ncbi:zinc finger protein 419-like isoform X1 [Vanessa tameamea]|uniref:Zinc finger protein 419-like isoform X1 n=1 Tax=Vanessa tameamea TaxID=334116 RepID=A0ABM4AY37_VANTA
MEPNDSEFKLEFETAKNLCRCCLSTDKRMNKIESYRGYFIDLADIIVSESDGLPQWLCYECCALLLKSVRFKQKVINAHTMLYDYHSRCAPFPVDVQDPELTKYASPYLSKSNVLVFDTSRSKNGYHKVLEHDKPNYLSNLIDINVPVDAEILDDNISIKDEYIFSEGDDDQPLLVIRTNRDKNLEDLIATDIKEEKKEKKKKVKKKMKSKSLRAVEDNLDTNVNLEASEPKRSVLRKPIEIDETKIRIIKLDPTEQLKQREEESKATLKFPFQCQLCFKGFNFEVKLKNHMFKHSPARGPYKCELCTMHFPSAYSSSVHALTHTRRFECVTCGRRMADRLAMINHYRSQHEGVLSVFTCDICGKISNNDKTHRGHMRNHHSGNRVKCDECGKSFVNRDSLVEHQLIHQGIKNYECEECGKKFRTRNQIRHHMVKHSDAKDFYCVECDVRFKSAHTLRQHLKRSSKHKDKKSLKFECGACAKRFETAAQLAAHTRVQHEGVREHRCGACGAALASRASLNKHARAVHAGLRAPPAHVCHTCGKMFRAKSTLVNHVRTHTGEKPYECGVCGRRFAQRTAMRTHIKLVHLKIHRSARIKPKLPPPETAPKSEIYKNESPLMFEWGRQNAQCEYFTVTAGP